MWAGVPWNPGGETYAPQMTYYWYYSCGGGVCRVLDIPGTWVHRSNPLILFYVPWSSQFHYKISIHEQVHYDQYGPGGLKEDLYNPTELRNQLIGLTAPTFEQLKSLVDATAETYVAVQSYIDAETLWIPAEVEAYSVSDSVAPMYIYQNCGRFHN